MIQLRTTRRLIGAALTASACAPALRAAEPTPATISPRAAEVACFPANPTEEQAAFIARFRALPPTLVPVGGGVDPSRFIVDPRAWVGTGTAAGSTGPGGNAQPVSLTYSFPKDTTVWGIAGISTPGPSELSQKLIALFGSGNLDLGREHIRQALATWRRACAVRYEEVADDNAPQDQLETRVATRGDIRIAGRTLGIDFFLAYNAFPSTLAGAAIGGGDMFINTSFFQAQWFNNPADNFRYFRNVVSHEHGHALGLIHTTPCDNSKLMEPFISSAFDTAQLDDIRAAQRNYGDRLAPNQSPAAAHSFGDLATPSPHSVRESLLSTNGAGTEDWFAFSLASPQPVTITVQPTGGTYTQGVQVVDCDGANFGVVNASNAGNLALEIRTADAAVVLFTSDAGANGVPESVTANLGAGSYKVRVVDVGPNQPGDQLVQLYNFTIRTNNALYPPRAIAGVHKRIFAGARCHFMGNVASWANEIGSSITAWHWDLDADGSFEVAGPQVFRTYPSNGVMPVSLRVTDSNGLTHTDTINVTVFNATASITGVSPGTAPRGSFTPVTITGANLKGVTSASQFTASGTGATFTGTPVVNTLGTSVTGLVLWVDANAALGTRTISVMNSDASGGPSGNATSGSILTIATPSLEPGPFSLLSPANDAPNVPLETALEWSASAGAFSYNVTLARDPSLERVLFQTSIASPTLTATLPLGTLEQGQVYYWRVEAVNPVGNTLGAPGVAEFTTTSPVPVCQGDLNGDLLRDVGDLVIFLGQFGTNVPQGTGADFNGDGAVNPIDLIRFLSNFAVPC
ncbi:MAG: PKD domain-containing protein [Phycisphaerales bacterium]